MHEKEVSFGEGLNGIVTTTEASTDGDGKPSVIITHGAGQGMQSTLLSKTAARLAELGFIVLRFNFGYIERKSAPSAGGKKEQPDLLAAIEYMKNHGEPILVGKSFGARVCANVALERSDVKALAFYGMPLQGMSKTSKPRDWSHLAKLNVPLLFITGDKDKLCPPDKLTEVLSAVNAPLTSEIVPGDHSFKPRSEDLAVKLCTEWINQLAAVGNELAD